ncbi:hypothetical protein FA13DRAFT_1793448 [Coprinellus micaceus]|uniref:Uncharacterized protein n=1 Tax=Coprinellus micaceus TaxID=71717 RepID=A0A4Y7T4K3_COPMI|nr:hypothetical protein FA13DRAFT_1793448 [Coprinellus micaceus]
MPNTRNILRPGPLAIPTLTPPGAGRTIYNPSRPVPLSHPRAEPPSAYALFCLTLVVSQSASGVSRDFLRTKWASLRAQEKVVYLEAAERKRDEWLADVSALPGGAILPYASLLPMKDADPMPNLHHSRALKTSDNARDIWMDRAIPESINKMLWDQEIDPDVLQEMEQAYINFSACEDFDDMDPKDPSDTASIDENVSITGSETDVDDACNGDRRGNRKWSTTPSVASEEHFRMEF